MPDWINLTPKGLFRVDYDIQSRNFIETPVDDPISYLRETCELTEGLTVRDLCEFVRNHEELKGFMSRYSGVHFIGENLAELDSACADTRTEISQVIVSWAARVTGVGDTKTLEMGAEVYAVENDVSEALSIARLSPAKYAHLPIVLDKEVVIDGDGIDPDLIAQKEYTLLEILHAFFQEIGFYGRPANRDLLFQEGKFELENIGIVDGDAADIASQPESKTS